VELNNAKEVENTRRIMETRQEMGHKLQEQRDFGYQRKDAETNMHVEGPGTGNESQSSALHGEDNQLRYPC
jgi:hypothetical protein